VRQTFISIPWRAALAAPLIALLALAARAVEAARVALVMGNQAYVAGPLKNPVNDAEAMATALRGLGFNVTLVKNFKRDDIGRTVEGFANRIRAGDEVVVFYAGHGLQVKGTNYLPAVDARIGVESDVALNSLNLNELLQRLDEAKAGVRLLLVDACRDNPYSRGFRSSARGLARVEGAPSGTLMHFATKPGGLADDGTGSNGLYTTELLKHLGTPGLPVESMLKRVASGVRQASGGQQQPWTEGALEGEFYFAVGGTAVAQPQPRPQAPVQLANVVPEPVRPAPEAPRQADRRSGEVFKDCKDCPEMVVIPSGSFVMGSPATDAVGAEFESPQRTVTISSFAAGRFEVTFAQWDACVAAAGCTHRPGDEGWGRGNQPVVNVNWADAQQYAKWLSGKTGKDYRLMSEAEWEYAARANSSGNYPWGNEVGERNANCDRCFTAWAGQQTAPVGQFAANAFGLHDMHGNAAEWVQDVWHENYKVAPATGIPWMAGGDQRMRVLRGGSWSAHWVKIRSASRYGDHLTNRTENSGFRVAWSL